VTFLPRVCEPCLRTLFSCNAERPFKTDLPGVFVNKAASWCVDREPGTPGAVLSGCNIEQSREHLITWTRQEFVFKCKKIVIDSRQLLILYIQHTTQRMESIRQTFCSLAHLKHNCKAEHLRTTKRPRDLRKETMFSVTRANAEVIEWICRMWHV
jgi:hypothetical protein